MRERIVMKVTRYCDFTLQLLVDFTNLLVDVTRLQVNKNFLENRFELYY